MELRTTVPQFKSFDQVALAALEEKQKQQRESLPRILESVKERVKKSIETFQLTDKQLLRILSFIVDSRRKDDVAAWFNPYNITTSFYYPSYSSELKKMGVTSHIKEDASDQDKADNYDFDSKKISLLYNLTSDLIQIIHLTGVHLNEDQIKEIYDN
jgi:hypothetical protein